MPNMEKYILNCTCCRADTPSHIIDHLCHIGKESIQNCTCYRADTARCTIFFSSFIAKSWLNNLKDNGQGQRSLWTTHPHMLMIIYAKHRKNPFRTTRTVERTWQYVLYFSSFIAKSWLNDLEDTGQGQRSLCTTHPLMFTIICA